MRSSISPLAILLLLAASTASAQDWAQEMFKASSHDFGTIARDAKAEYEFTFENPYLEDVHIASVRTSCGCTSVKIKDGKDTLKSWETGAVVAHINSDKFRGKKGATITVTFDRPYYAQARLHVRTYIRDDVVLNPGSAQLGTVDQGAEVLQRIAIGSSRQGWRILDVKSDNPHLSGEVVEVKRQWNQTVYHLTVRLDATAPTGYLRDHVRLITNDPTQSQVPVAVEGRIVPGITIGPRMLSMGVVQPGQKVRKQVVVKGKEPFRITGIQTAGNGFQFDGVSSEEPKRFHVVPVTFVAGSEAGTVTETIYVETDLGRSTAEFSAQAIVAGESVAANEETPERNPEPLTTERADATLPMPAESAESNEPIETAPPAAEPVLPTHPAATEPVPVANTGPTRRVVAALPPGLPTPPPFVARRLGLIEPAQNPPQAADSSSPANERPQSRFARPLRGRILGFAPGR